MRPSDKAADLLARLAARQRIACSVAAVTAHPDDECVGMGANLVQFDDLALLQITDGAPLAAGIAEAAGFATRQDYAKARRGELVDALQVAADGRISRLVCYEISDGTLVDHLTVAIERLIEDLAWVDAVFTHPYEGGHADHDAVAFAVQTACIRLAQWGGAAPVRLEFTSYHRHLDLVRSGRFRDAPGHPEIAIALTSESARRKEAAFACHRSQKDNLRFFGFGPERFRRAPTYDFTKPPADDVMYGDQQWARLARAFGQAGLHVPGQNPTSASF